MIVYYTRYKKFSYVNLEKVMSKHERRQEVIAENNFIKRVASFKELVLAVLQV